MTRFWFEVPFETEDILMALHGMNIDCWIRKPKHVILVTSPL